MGKVSRTQSLLQTQPPLLPGWEPADAASDSPQPECGGEAPQRQEGMVPDTPHWGLAFLQTEADFTLEQHLPMPVLTAGTPSFPRQCRGSGRMMLSAALWFRAGVSTSIRLATVVSFGVISGPRPGPVLGAKDPG